MNKPVNLDNPLVSVILPVHNGERLLSEAIESILEQDYQPLEIIIVDDGSTDSTAQIITSFEGDIHYFYQSNSGPAAARNFGIHKAKGDFIAFIDSDDLWPKDKLLQQMNCFKAFPKVEIVQGLISRTYFSKMDKDRKKGVEIDFSFIYTNLGSMIMRRSVFDKIEYFDENLTFHEDTDFWLRAREADLHILIQRKLALIYRIHGRNMTAGQNVESTGFLNILRRSIVRRRKTAGFVKDISNLTFIPDLLINDKKYISNGEKTPEQLPLVSIILYANDDSANLHQAIASIRDQGYYPVELVLIHSSLKQVPAYISDAFDQTRLINEYSNLAAGLNAALQRANGEVLAFLDAEGAWAPGKLKTQINFLLDHPADVCIVGRTRNIIMPDVKYPLDLINEYSLRKRTGDLLSTLLVRRSVLEQVGEFRSELTGMEETDWLLRARDLGFPQKMLPQVFFYRFVEPDFHIVGIDKMKSALLESVRSSVHRKRNVS